MPDEYGTYVAIRRIFIGRVLAFNVGDRVPVSHVESGTVSLADVALAPGAAAPPVDAFDERVKAAFLTEMAAANLQPPIQSGRYVFPVSPGGVATSNVLGNSSVRVAPWAVTREMQINRVGAEVTVAGQAGSKYRIGIWSDSGFGYPGTLLLDAGTIAADTVAVQELVCSLTLIPGLYWIGGAVQDAATTQPTMRTANNWTPPISIPIVGGTLPVAGQLVVGHSSSMAGAFTAWAAGPSPTSLYPARVFVKVA